MPICERTHNPGTWPYYRRCTAVADVRLRLTEDGYPDRELNLCIPHANEARAQYSAENVVLLHAYSVGA